MSLLLEAEHVNLPIEQGGIAVTGPTDTGALAPQGREWRCPVLRKLPIAATAGSTNKASGAQNDGNTNKSGDVSNLS